MQTTDAVVRLQTLDGNWETCGIDRASGIVPEDIQLSVNSWGADTGSFTLRRSPRSQWPDLTAFTPVEVEVGGVVVWDGFISQTPTSDNDGGSISVQCKGWQYHLDDDSFEKLWVHSYLPDWKDAKSFPSINLNYFRPGTEVNTGDGKISVGWAKGNNMQQGTFTGVVLDLGPVNTAKSVSVTWSTPTGTGWASALAGVFLYCRGSNSLNTLNSISNDAFTRIAMPAANTTTTSGGSFATPCRYVFVGVAWTNATTTAVNDTLIELKNITTAYSSDATIFDSTSKLISGITAAKVVSEVLPYAPLLSQDTSQIDTSSTFKIPHFSSIDGGRSPREYLTGVNAYEDNLLRLKPGRVLNFTPRPTVPSYSVGAWGGATFTDASANSGDEIYNKAVVESVDFSGQSSRISRYAGATANPRSGLTERLPSAITNGDFESDTVSSPQKLAPTGWSASTVASSYAFTTIATTALTSSATSVTVATGAGAFPASGYILIGSEIINYTNATGTTLTGLSRGCFGTTAASAAIGATVSMVNAVVPTTTSPISGTKSAKWLPVGESTSVLTGTFSSSQTFKAGISYQLSFNIKATLLYGGTAYVVLELPDVKFGTSTDFGQVVDTTSIVPGSDPMSSSITLQWTPMTTVTGSSVTVRLTAASSYYSIYKYQQGTIFPDFTYYLVDDFTISSIKATLPDRRGFTRTKRLQVNAPITPTSGQRIGDTFLTGHQSTPLKGDLGVEYGGVKEYLTGADIHPSRLLLSAGELIHFSNRTDPDTGAQGRDGTIAAVSYDHNAQSAQISIDNQRNRFETFLERLAVVTNNRLGR